MAVGNSSILILTKHSNDTEAVTGLTAFCDDIFSRTLLYASAACLLRTLSTVNCSRIASSFTRYVAWHISRLCAPEPPTPLCAGRLNGNDFEVKYPLRHPCRRQYGDHQRAAY
jgi:hypothetical protein